VTGVFDFFTEFGLDFLPAAGFSSSSFLTALVEGFDFPAGGLPFFHPGFLKLLS
jgi:hypothetical protein